MKFISITNTSDEKSLSAAINNQIIDADNIIVLNDGSNSFSDNLVNELNINNQNVSVVNSNDEFFNHLIKCDQLIKKISKELDSKVILVDSDFESLILELEECKSQNDKYMEYLKIKDEYIELMFPLLKRNSQINYALEKLRGQYYSLSKQLTDKDFEIDSYKHRLISKDLEIDYLNNKGILNLVFSSLFSYPYIILKSKSKDIFTNIKLFRILKNNELFDRGFYLEKYPEIADTTCGKLFSLELHFVCFGFDEKKKFYKKYFFYSNKKQLLSFLKNNK